MKQSCKPLMLVLFLGSLTLAISAAYAQAPLPSMPSEVKTNINGPPTLPNGQSKDDISVSAKAADEQIRAMPGIALNMFGTSLGNAKLILINSDGITFDLRATLQDERNCLLRKVMSGCNSLAIDVTENDGTGCLVNRGVSKKCRALSPAATCMGGTCQTVGAPGNCSCLCAP